MGQLNLLELCTFSSGFRQCGSANTAKVQIECSASARALFAVCVYMLLRHTGRFFRTRIMFGIGCDCRTGYKPDLEMVGCSVIAVPFLLYHSTSYNHSLVSIL